MHPVSLSTGVCSHTSWPCVCPYSAVVVQFEESRITVNESAGASVEVCLVKEGMTSLIVTVTVIAQELTADNSASGKQAVSIKLH